MRLIIGNIIAFIASLLFVYSGILKKKKKILIVQIIQKGFSAISNIVLKGYSGAVVHFISLIRNILCYYDKLYLMEKIVISILTIILAIIFNNTGMLGILPLISSLIYLWFMDTKDIIKFKYLMLITIILWGTYDLSIKSYTSFGFNVFSAIATIISIIQIKNNNRIVVKAGNNK